MVRPDRALGSLATPIRRARLRSLETVMFALLADHERAIEAGDVDSATHDVATASIVDMRRCARPR